MLEGVVNKRVKWGFKKTNVDVSTDVRNSPGHINGNERELLGLK